MSITLHTSSPTFIDFLISFYFSLLQVFGHLLGPGSFDSPKRFLACKQSYIPITFGGIGLILTFIIGPTIYLRSWALVFSIIVVRLMVNQRPFFLEALVRIDNNTFLFQQHLKATCDLLPPLP
jgi:hypothetical protein